ncbi:MAG: BspA family leucine-rich repeat surface protein [Mollicutes bacterium]|nr:BspA family leucine-rich repeat surface protein [Mollicutes bacterium]
MKSLNKKGLTLMEIIISVALLSLILLFMYQLLSDISFDKDNEYFASNDQNQRIEIIKTIKDEIGFSTVKNVVKVSDTTLEITVEVTEIKNDIFYIVASDKNLSIYKTSQTPSNLIRAWTYYQGTFGSISFSKQECRDNNAEDCGTIYKCHLPVYTENENNNLNNNNIIDDIFFDFIDVPFYIYDQNSFLNSKLKKLHSYNKLQSTATTSLHALLNQSFPGYTIIKSLDLNKTTLDYLNDEDKYVYFSDAPDLDVIVAWQVDNTVFIGQRGGVKIGPSFESAFIDAPNIVEIDFSEVDASYVLSMHSAFRNAGSKVTTTFALNLGNKFNTSNVNNMFRLFHNTGQNSVSFALNLGKGFNTSNVTNMKSMFENTGASSLDFSLNLGPKFNTSNVTDMNQMFFRAGLISTSFNLNLGPMFYTSNVENMQNMFRGVGRETPEWTLNLQSFVINNSSVVLTNFARNMGATNIIFGGGWGNASTSHLNNNFLLYGKQTTVHGNSTFHSYRIGNNTMWTRWRGSGNTTFILDIP